jgi:hypothetical protein
MNHLQIDLMYQTEYNVYKYSLQALVVADFATILSFVPQLKLLNDFKRLKPILLPTFRWAFTALCWFQTSSTWLTLLLTVNRYTAVWRPMTARWLFTIKRTHAVSARAVSRVLERCRVCHFVIGRSSRCDGTKERTRF